MRYRIIESKRTLEAGRYPLTSEAVRQHYFNQHISQKPPESGHSVAELVKKHQKIEIDSSKLKEGTIKNYKATEKYLNNFMQHYFEAADVDLMKFDYEALLELEGYIRAHPLNSHTPCLGNGIYMHMERIEKMFGMAKDMRWIQENPFNLYQSKRKKISRENLKIQQFAKIENHDFQHTKLNYVRDLFVFDCYLGVSYIGLINLKEKHFELTDGKLFCTVYRHKSTELCGIPVADTAKTIMDKYRYSPDAIARGKIFPFISNQEFNRNLKVIAGIFNIPVDFDTRKARRFFAKELNFKNGVPLETASKLLGYSKISTTKENYADVDEEKIIDDTAKVQEKFNRKKAIIYCQFPQNLRHWARKLNFTGSKQDYLINGLPV